MGERQQDQRETPTGDGTVLVVEDQKEIAMAYTRALSTAFDVRTATSGAEALSKVDETVDVVLLDRRMPEMSGDEVLTRLRERGLAVQVAMVTAVTPDTDIVEMPFDEYITKPASTDELHAVTEVLLDRTTSDGATREYFRLAVKKVVLENTGKGWTDAHETVCRRLDELTEHEVSTVDDHLLPENCSFH